ncbi:Malto-oligosyltrehalose trehalohydrolase [Pseudoclavibacter triregionum]|nr:Malto-oligosyltrehalose trehalohydrolase [Pseudoclavibacter triregionum]
MHAPALARREDFDVWAPIATAVELEVDGRRYPLVRDPGESGWWRPTLEDRAAIRDDVERAPDGVDYGYRLDGDEQLLPDPRSVRQPQGVHGPSRTYELGSYRWGDDAWSGRQLAGAVIMEVHIGTFTPGGTLDSAIERLDHLAELGIEFVELMPVAAWDGEHGWGYDGVDWYAVHEPYGGPAAYQRFVDACHQRGLGVIQDVVYNHFGPSGAYLPRFGPYLAAHHTTAWGSAVNLDGPDSDEVRRFILDNVRLWVEDFHVDALRLDAVHALVDTRAKHLLEDIANVAAEFSAHVNRPITIIAESDLNDPRIITPREAGGYALDAQWSDDFHHALHVAVTGDRTGYFEDFDGLEAMAKVLREGFFHDGSLSSFRRRLHGRPLNPSTQAWRLVVCNQNHDQVGNRADGSRWTDRLSDGQLRILALMTLTAPFTPMLFMGEEWGTLTPFQFFCDHQDPELARLTSEGRIREFSRMGWDPNVIPDPQDRETFLRSKLRWEELEEQRHRSLFQLYKDLIRLRKSRSALTSPWLDQISVEYDTEAQVFCFWRDDVLVAVNFGTGVAAVDIDVDRPDTPLLEGPELLLRTDDGVEIDGFRATLPPHSGAVFGPRVPRSLGYRPVETGLIEIPRG